MHSNISGIRVHANKIKLIVLIGRLIIYGDTVPSSQVSFFNNQNQKWNIANLSTMTGFWDAISLSLSKC